MLAAKHATAKSAECLHSIDLHRADRMFPLLGGCATYPAFTAAWSKFRNTHFRVQRVWETNHCDNSLLGLRVLHRGCSAIEDVWSAMR